MSDFCPKCGQPIDKNTGKCPNSCFIPSPQGFPLQNYAGNQRPSIPPAENNVNNSYKKPKSKSNLPIIISASVAAGVILIGAVAAIALSSSSSRPISAGNNNFEIGHSYAFESKNPKTTKKNTVTTAPTTKTAETTTKKEPQFLEATDEEIDDLLDLIKTEFFIFDIFEYSASDSDALQTVERSIMCGLAHPYAYLYFFPNDIEYIQCKGRQFKDSPINERDPLNKFGDYGEYAKVPADNMDWLIKNIFNVEPDRSADIYSFNGSSLMPLYYYNGFYYFAFSYGDGPFPTLSIVNITADEDNIYTVELKGVFNDLGETYAKNYTVVCRLSNINGKRQWNFLSSAITGEAY